MTKDEAIAEIRRLHRARRDHLENSVIQQELARDCRLEADRLHAMFGITERDLSTSLPPDKETI